MWTKSLRWTFSFSQLFTLGLTEKKNSDLFNPKVNFGEKKKAQRFYFNGTPYDTGNAYLLFFHSILTEKCRSNKEGAQVWIRIGAALVSIRIQLGLGWRAFGLSLDSDWFQFGFGFVLVLDWIDARPFSNMTNFQIVYLWFTYRPKYLWLTDPLLLSRKHVFHGMFFLFWILKSKVHFPRGLKIHADREKV